MRRNIDQGTTASDSELSTCDRARSPSVRLRSRHFHTKKQTLLRRLCGKLNGSGLWRLRAEVDRSSGDAHQSLLIEKGSIFFESIASDAVRFWTICKCSVVVLACESSLTDLFSCLSGAEQCVEAVGIAGE